ncbi:hypothetical protein ABPG74_001677 [Tetrahymena malaccensis]
MSAILCVFLTLLLIKNYATGQQNCQKNEYFDLDSHSCQKCDSSCLECYGPTNQDCYQCQLNQYYNIHNKICSDTCNYAVQDNGSGAKICFQCSKSYCKKCRDIWSCDECIEGFSFDNYGECVNTCSYGQYFDEGQCQDSCSTTVFKNIYSNTCQSKSYCPSYDSLTDFCTSKQIQFALLVEQNQQMYSFYDDGYIAIYEFPSFLFKFDAQIEVNSKIIKWFILDQKNYVIGGITSSQIIFYALENLEIIINQVLDKNQGIRIQNIWQNRYFYQIKGDGQIQIFDFVNQEYTQIIEMWHCKYLGIFTLLNQNILLFVKIDQTIQVQSSNQSFIFNRIQVTENLLIGTDQLGIVTIYKLNFELDEKDSVTGVTINLLQNTTTDLQKYNFKYASLQILDWIYVKDSNYLYMFLLDQSGQIISNFQVASNDLKIICNRYIMVITDTRNLEIYDMKQSFYQKIVNQKLQDDDETNVQNILVGPYQQDSNQFQFILIPFNKMKISVITQNQTRFFQQCTLRIKQKILNKEDFQQSEPQIQQYKSNQVTLYEGNFYIPNALIYNQDRSLLIQFCQQGYFMVFELETNYFVNSISLSYKPQKVIQFRHAIFESIGEIIIVLADLKSIQLIVIDSQTLLPKKEQQIASIQDSDLIEICFDVMELRILIFQRSFSTVRLQSYIIDAKDTNQVQKYSETDLNQLIQQYDYIQVYMSSEIIFLRQQQILILKNYQLQQVCSYNHTSDVPYMNNYLVKNQNNKIIFFENSNLYELSTESCEASVKIQTQFLIKSISADIFPVCIFVQGQKEAIIYDVAKYQQLYKISKQRTLNLSNFSWINGSILGYIEDYINIKVFDCQNFSQSEITVSKSVLDFFLVNQEQALVIYVSQGIQLFSIQTSTQIIIWDIQTNFLENYCSEEIVSSFSLQSQRYFAFQNYLGEISFLFNPNSSIQISQAYPGTYELDYYVSNTTQIQYINELSIFVYVNQNKLLVIQNKSSQIVQQINIRNYGELADMQKIIYNKQNKQIIVAVYGQILLLDQANQYKMIRQLLYSNKFDVKSNTDGDQLDFIVYEDLKQLICLFDLNKLANQWCITPSQSYDALSSKVNLLLIMKTFNNIINIYYNQIEVYSIQQQGKIVFQRTFDSIFESIKCFEKTLTCVILDSNNQLIFIRYINMNEIELTKIKNNYIKKQLDAVFDEIHGCIHIPVINSNMLFVYCVQSGQFQLKRQFKLKQTIIKMIDFDDKQETLIYVDDQYNIQGFKMMKYSSSATSIKMLDYVISLSVNANDQQPIYMFIFDKKRSILIIGLSKQIFVVDTINSSLVYTIVLQSRITKIKYERSTNLIKCFEEYFYEQINLDLVYQQNIINPFPNYVKSYSLLVGFIYFQMDIQQNLLLAYDQRQLPISKSIIDFTKISNYTFLQNVQFSLINSQSDIIDFLLIMNNLIARVQYNKNTSQALLFNYYIDPDNDLFQSEWVIKSDKNPKQLIIFCHNSLKIKIFDADQNTSKILVIVKNFLIQFYLSYPSQQYLIAVDKNNKCIIADISLSKSITFELQQLNGIYILNRLGQDNSIEDAEIIEESNKIIIQCQYQFFLLSMDHIFDTDSSKFFTQEIQMFQANDAIEQLFIDIKQNMILISTANDVIIQQYSINSNQMIYSNLHKPSYGSIDILDCYNYLLIYSKSSINVYQKFFNQTYQKVISNYNEFSRNSTIKEITLIQQDYLYQNNFFIVSLTNSIKILSLDPLNIIAPLISVQTLLLKNFEVTSMETFNLADIQYFYLDMIKYGERISINNSFDFFSLRSMIQQITDDEQTCVFEFKESLVMSDSAYWNNEIQKINKQSQQRIEDLVIRVKPNTSLNIPELDTKYISPNGMYVSFTQGTKFKDNDQVFLPQQINLGPISIFQIYNLNVSFSSIGNLILDGLKSQYLKTAFLEKITIGSQDELIDNSFIFANLEFVSIKDLVIKDINLINNQMQVPLFLFQNISKVILTNITVTNISSIDYTTLFSFQNSTQVKIINFTMDSCSISTPLNLLFEMLNNQSQSQNDYYFIRNSQNLTSFNPDIPVYKFISFFQINQDLIFSQDQFHIIDYSLQNKTNSAPQKKITQPLTYHIKIVDEGIASYIFSFYNSQNITLQNVNLSQNTFSNIARVILVQNCQNFQFSQVQINQAEFYTGSDQQLRGMPFDDNNQFEEFINLSSLDESENVYEDYSSDNFELYNLQPFTARSLICFHKINSVLIQDFQIENMQIFQNFLIFVSVLQTKQIQFNNTYFNKIFQSELRQAIIMKAQNIDNLQINDSLFQNSNNIIFLDSQELKVSRTISLKNNVINIDKIKLKSSFNQNSYLIVNSFIIKITNSIFYNLINQQNGNQNLDFSQKILFNDFAALHVGIINVFNFNNFFGDNLTFFQCKSRNIAGICIQNGILSIIQNSKFEGNTATNNAGGLLFYKNQVVQIVNNVFLSNKSLQGSGGAIYIIQSVIDAIVNCEFTNNSATANSGGAIYITQSDIIRTIKNNNFTKNKAAVGASIRIVDQFDTFKIPLIIQKNKFLNNTSTLYGSTVTSFPQKMVFVDSNLKIIQIPTIQHTSGYNLKNPIYIALLDESDQIVKSPANMRYTQNINNNNIFSDFILQEFNSYQLFINMQKNKNKVKVVGKSTYYFEEDKPIFLLNITLIGIIQNEENLTIQTLNIYPNLMQNYSQVPYSPLQVSLRVNFTICQRGEVPIYQEEQNLTLCTPCPSGKYSLENITINEIQKKKNFTCNLCPESAEYCEKDIIKLKNEYWKNTGSDQIFYCNYNSKNCQAQLYSDPEKICAEGYIGVFCKECDYKGSVWGQKYGRFNTVNCRKCSESFNSLNLIILVILIIILIIYILYQLSLQRSYAKKSCIAYYLRKAKIIPMGISEFTNLNAVYTKLLINHLQILALYSQLNIPIPRFFSQSTELFGGDPNSIVSANIDCLSSEFTNLPTYINISLLSILNPFILFALITLIRTIYIFLRYVKGLICHFIKDNEEINMISQNIKPKFKIQKMVRAFKIKMVTCLIFLYFFFAPSILNRILSYMVCAQIDDIQYIVGMSNLTCFNSEHKLYLFTFLFPVCLLWALIIPTYFFFKLKSNREYLDQIRMKFQFGFIYQEYKRSCYYWELVKICLKFTIISTLMIFYEQQTIRIILVATLVLVYNQLIYFIQPFVSKILNQAEKYSTITLIFTGFLILPINDYTNTEDIYILIINFFILLINISFLIFMLKLIFLQPLPYSYTKMNYFQKCIYKLKLYFPNLFSSVKFKPSDPYRVFRNWKKLKMCIYKFVNFKDKKKLKDSHIIEAATQNYIKSLANLENSEYTSKDYDKKEICNTVQIFSFKNLESPTLLNKQQTKSKLIQQNQMSNIITNTSSRSKKSDLFNNSNQIIKLSQNSKLSNKSKVSNDTNQININSSIQKQSPRKTGILINKANQQQLINPKQGRKISFPTNLIIDQIIPQHKLSSFSKIKEDKQENKIIELEQTNNIQN